MANNKQDIQIPRPSQEEVQKYIDKFNNDKTFKTKNGEEKDLEHYREQEKAINHLFGKYRCHNNAQKVLLKVAILNDFYSTNLNKIGDGGTYKISKHIVEKNLSQAIKDGDESVIEKIANIKGKRMYSFASKYCAHHNADEYPIYDNFVDKMLNHFRREDKDFKQKCADSLKNIGKKFTRTEDLKDYPTLKCVIETFKSHYGLEKFSFREIDWYLWLAGQEHFK